MAKKAIQIDQQGVSVVEVAEIPAATLDSVLGPGSITTINEPQPVRIDPMLVNSLRSLVSDLVSADSHRQRQEIEQKITEILDTL